MAYEPMSFAVGFNAEYGGIQNSLFHVQKKLDKTMEKLSTGQRINDMKDDEGGKAIANTMSSWKSGTDESIYNLKEFITMTKIAEKSLNDIQDILFEMKQTVDRLNGIEDTTDRSGAQAQLRELAMAINKIVEHTEYKGVKLFNIKAFGVDDSAYLSHTMKNDDIVLSHSDRFIRYGAGSEDFLAWDLGMDPRSQQLGMVVGAKIEITLQDVYRTEDEDSGQIGQTIATLDLKEAVGKLYINGKKLGEIAEQNGIDLSTEEGIITAIKLTLGEDVKVDIVEKEVSDTEAVYNQWTTAGGFIAGTIRDFDLESEEAIVWDSTDDWSTKDVLTAFKGESGKLYTRDFFNEDKVTDSDGNVYTLITDATGKNLYIDLDGNGIVNSADDKVEEQVKFVDWDDDGVYSEGSSDAILGKPIADTKKTVEIYIQTPGDFVYGYEETDSNGKVIGVKQQSITSTFLTTYEREFKGTVEEKRIEGDFAAISISREVRKIKLDGLTEAVNMTKKTIISGDDDQTLGDGVVYTGVIGNRQHALYFANVDNEGNDITDKSSTVGAIDQIGQVEADEGLFDVSVMSNENAALARVQIEAAINQINELRGVLAAMQHQAESLINQRMEESLGAESQISHITDTDYAKELAQFTKQQIAQQAGINMLSQKRQAAQLVTQLLR